MKTDVEGEYYAVKVVFFGELTAIGRYNSVLFYCGHSDGVVFRKGNKKGASTTRRYAGVYLRLYESGGGIVCGDYPVAMKICVCFICLVLYLPCAAAALAAALAAVPPTRLMTLLVMSSLKAVLMKIPLGWAELWSRM